MHTLETRVMRCIAASPHALERKPPPSILMIQYLVPRYLVYDASLGTRYTVLVNDGLTAVTV